MLRKICLLLIFLEFEKPVFKFDASFLFRGSVFKQFALKYEN